MSAILAIVPAYNEQQCIQQTIDELRRVCPGVDYLIVNDGSRDETAAICRRRHFNYINVPINCGLASGVQAGMKYAERNGYSAVVQFDAAQTRVHPAYVRAHAKNRCRRCYWFTFC